MLKQVLKLLIAILLLSCSDQNVNEFININFDKNVISNISQYDSIRKLVISNIDSFDFEVQNSYTYVYNFDASSEISTFSNDSLPISILQEVKNTFKQLGEHYILGFTISKDSCLEILVRNKYLESKHLDIRERLYWKQCHDSFQKDPGIQDTILSNDWKYRIWLDKRVGFL